MDQNYRMPNTGQQQQQHLPGMMIPQQQQQQQYYMPQQQSQQQQQHLYTYQYLDAAASGLMMQQQYQREFKLHSEDFPALAGGPGQQSGMVQLQQQQQMQMLQQQKMKATWDGSASVAAQQDPQQQQQPKEAKEGDRFGLIGLLGVIRMTDADLNTLALGTDLTTLGLDLSSEQSLCQSFSGAVHHNVELLSEQALQAVPQCYKEEWLDGGRLELVGDDTLFYLFYSDTQNPQIQLAVCRELCTRGWSYHKRMHVWFDGKGALWDCVQWTRAPATMNEIDSLPALGGGDEMVTLATIEKFMPSNVTDGIAPPQNGKQQQLKPRGSMLLSSGNGRLDGGDPVLYGPRSGFATQQQQQQGGGAIGGSGQDAQAAARRQR